MKSKDLMTVLEDWPDGAGVLRVRKLIGDDGESFIQMRVDLGVLQMQLDGRPDGERPYGHATMLEYMRKRIAGTSRRVRMSDSKEEALTREMLQYYRRRISLMALAEQLKSTGEEGQADDCFRRAVADADHNLAILDLLTEHYADEEFIRQHTGYRAFILMHRTACLAERSLLNSDAERAIEQIKAGRSAIEECANEADGYDDDDDEDDGAFIRELQNMERRIRAKHSCDRTLREQLEDAIAAEDFEQAARLRDALAKRGSQLDI